MPAVPVCLAVRPELDSSLSDLHFDIPRHILHSIRVIPSISICGVPLNFISTSLTTSHGFVELQDQMSVVDCTWVLIYVTCIFV